MFFFSVETVFRIVISVNSKYFTFRNGYATIVKGDLGLDFLFSEVIAICRGVYHRPSFCKNLLSRKRELM